MPELIRHLALLAAVLLIGGLWLTADIVQHRKTRRKS